MKHTFNLNKKYFLFTFPVPGGPANKTARPAIFLALINSTITPAAYLFDIQNQKLSKFKIIS